MNKIFIISSIDEIKLLQGLSMSNIIEVIKDYKKVSKKNKIELQYSNILKKISNNTLTIQVLNKFLNKKYKDGKVCDYINIVKDDKIKEYKFCVNKYDEIFDLSKGLSSFDKLDYKLKISITTPIISIITLYESFIRNLIITDCLEGNFDLINNETINFSHLSSLKYNEEAIKNYLIETFCNNKLYGDNKRIKEIIKTLSIDCNDCSSLIEDFNEIYFRRNIYAHSITNLTNDYQNLPIEIKEKWAKNNSLINTPEYFKHAFKILNKIILMILIKKCLYKKKDKADLDTIDEIIYNKFYYKGSYEVACFAYNQLKGLNWITDTQRYQYFVNYMVCLKNTNPIELKKESILWNTSTVAPIYKLAKKLIIDDYENINNLIINIYKSEVDYFKLDISEREFCISKNCITEWPLFIDYRKTEYFNQLKILLNF